MRLFMRFAVGLALILGLLMVASDRDQAFGENEKYVMIEVQPNLIALPGNQAKVPIQYARIRNTELREKLTKEMGALYIERAYSVNTLPDGSTEKEDLSDTFLIIFPDGTDVAGELSNLDGMSAVVSAEEK